MMDKNEQQIEEANIFIENGVAEMYRGFFRLRQLHEFQEEYDSMGAIINMLMQDRDHIRKKYKELRM